MDAFWDALEAPSPAEQSAQLARGIVLTGALPFSPFSPGFDRVLGHGPVTQRDEHRDLRKRIRVDSEDDDSGCELCVPKTKRRRISRESDASEDSASTTSVKRSPTSDRAFDTPSVLARAEKTFQSWLLRSEIIPCASGGWLSTSTGRQRCYCTDCIAPTVCNNTQAVVDLRAPFESVTLRSAAALGVLRRARAKARETGNSVKRAPSRRTTLASPGATRAQYCSWIYARRRLENVDLPRGVRRATSSASSEAAEQRVCTDFGIQMRVVKHFRAKYEAANARARAQKRHAKPSVGHKHRRTTPAANRSYASVNETIESVPCRSPALQRIHDVVAIVKQLVARVCDDSEALPAGKHS